MSLHLESRASNGGQICGPVPTNGDQVSDVSLLTSVVGVSMCAGVIVAIHVQGYIVLAHQVHDLQHMHAMQHTSRDEVKWVYRMAQLGSSKMMCTERLWTCTSFTMLMCRSLWLSACVHGHSPLQHSPKTCAD